MGSGAWATRSDAPVVRVVVSSSRRAYPVASWDSVMEIGDGVAPEAMVRSISPIRGVAKWGLEDGAAGSDDCAAIVARVAGRVREGY